jgi:hypothetical protein
MQVMIPSFVVLDLKWSMDKKHLLKLTKRILCGQQILLLETVDIISFRNTSLSACLFNGQQLIKLVLISKNKRTSWGVIKDKRTKLIDYF